MDKEQLILRGKETKTLKVLKRLLPKIGKFNYIELEPVMQALREEVGIRDQEEAEEIIASLESHGLANCNIYQATPTYSNQTALPKMLFKGFVTSDGVQFLRRENRGLMALALSAALYIAIGAFLMIIVSVVTGEIDGVSALWMGGLAGFALKVYGVIEKSIQSRLSED